MHKLIQGDSIGFSHSEIVEMVSPNGQFSLRINGNGGGWFYITVRKLKMYSLRWLGI